MSATKTPKYTHVCNIAFSLESDHEYPSHSASKEIRAAIMKRVTDLMICDDVELREAIEHEDTSIN